ncbi:hypothetical protein HELRODRAFT_89290, partial [Helobdella robusta]|uniref:SSD domain-containing protein n=1 Tax=Helobdella robusta TaxID=6412 RepID=T1G7B5_HELRO
SLMNLNNVKSMCLLEDTLKSSCRKFFEWHCDKQIINYNMSPFCCKSWSLGNYIAMINNKTDCLELIENDLLKVESLLKCCANKSPAYNKTYVEKCLNNYSDVNNTSLDMSLCTFYAHELDIVRKYIVDKNFGKSGFLLNALSFVPLSYGITSKKFFQCVMNVDLKKSNIEIVAMSYDFKHNIFDEQLLSDSLFILLSAVCVIILLFLYTRSIFITLSTVIMIFYSVVFSYFIYSYILSIQFFPFMNLLTFIILISTGVDNVFIIFHDWYVTFSNSNSLTTQSCLQINLKHSFKSIFLTSLTTSTAFLSGYMNNIIVLKCFALYSSIALLSYFLMASFMVPAIIILHCKISSISCLNITSFKHFFDRVDFHLGMYFNRFITSLVVKLRWLWISSFIFISLSSFFIIFIRPKLKITQSSSLKLFVDWHPSEIFDEIINSRFNFTVSDEATSLPIVFVWGVKLEKPLSRLNIDDEYNVTYDESFNLFTSAAQLFLVDFCKKIRKSSFYAREPGIKKHSCFIESFQKLMSRKCVNVYGADLHPCCSSTKFPYPEKIFKHCLFFLLPEMSTNYFFDQTGVRFDPSFSQVIALVIEFPSNQTIKSSYEDYKKFYHYMSNFTKLAMELDAPEELRGGWFTSILNFYDLQESIITVTPLSLIISVLVAALFALIVTGNIILTCFVVLNITCSLVITTAILVLIGWSLDIFESIAISLTVGLSVDFVLHYVNAYQHTNGADRHTRVNETIKVSGAITYAALSTFSVGLSLIPSKVLAYKQISSFLVVVIATSWLSSCLFNLSILYVAGPLKNFGQLPSSCLRKKCQSVEK